MPVDRSLTRHEARLTQSQTGNDNTNTIIPKNIDKHGDIPPVDVSPPLYGRRMVTSTSTRTFADDVREIDEFFRVLVARIDPDAVPLCEVTDLWTAFDTVERRAAATKLLLARKVEEAGRWKRDGHRSAAEQLAAIAGTSVTAAKNQLETSKKVAKLPTTEKALRDGEVVGREGRSDRGGGGGRTRGRGGPVGRRGGCAVGEGQGEVSAGAGQGSRRGA